MKDLDLPAISKPSGERKELIDGNVVSYIRMVAGWFSTVEQHEYRFNNGYGASVIRGPYTSGGMNGLWELAVMLCDPQREDVWKLTYETPITDEVVDHLTEREVCLLLKDIRSLPPREGLGPSRDESHETHHKIPPITAEDIEALRRSYE